MSKVQNNEPLSHELPSEYADRLGIYYTQQVSKKHKKDKGQFFTPIPIAKLMASYSTNAKRELKVLDPGCGTAILSCTLIEKLVQNNVGIQSINLVAYETDSELIPYLQKALSHLSNWLLEKQIDFQFTVKTSDFVLDTIPLIGTDINDDHLFDVIISNPPYFKLPKDDERAIAAKESVNGHANIYSIFMGLAARLLLPNGELIFITPRSFASGNYFASFRELFFKKVQIENIHLFNSRKDTFNRDSVLQETVIIKAINEAINTDKQVLLSSSTGLKDIFEPTIKQFRSHELIDLDSNEKVLHLPTSDKEESILQLISSWNNVLMNYNIQISTGPVVSFRATQFIQNHYQNGTVFLAPLFWLHNINKMFLEWPKELKDKGQFIRIEDGSKSILIPNKNYIFLRRFSTKDDNSRLIAAPYFCNYFQADFIGVENKANYIYRKNGHLDRNETAGLCALLNSELFDIYFQTFNGNVNVSATELRGMRFPSLDVIKEIGNQIILSNDYSMGNVNEIVNSKFDLTKTLSI